MQQWKSFIADQIRLLIFLSLKGSITKPKIRRNKYPHADGLCKRCSLAPFPVGWSTEPRITPIWGLYLSTMETWSYWRAGMGYAEEWDKRYCSIIIATVAVYVDVVQYGFELSKHVVMFNSYRPVHLYGTDIDLTSPPEARSSCGRVFINVFSMRHS